METNFTPEHEADLSKRTHEFFNLSEEEKQKLAERVVKWHGLVRIVIHPYFEGYRGKDSLETKRMDHQNQTFLRA